MYLLWRHLKLTKQKFKKTFTEIINETYNEDIDEAALPAYAHKNVFIDHLFWKRIEIANTYANKGAERKRILDFGCGSGVLSYLLAKNGHQVTSSDIEFSPLNLS